MIAIIDYDAGNLTSVARAVSHIGFQCRVTSDAGEILKAEHIIFPGVGAAGSAMASLKRTGLDSAINDAFHMGIPILGICLGTQVIMGHSEENDTPCLGIINGLVRAFQPGKATKNGNRLKIPHMGWNRVAINKEHPVLSGIDRDDEFYFVHGFYPEPQNTAHVLGTTNYGVLFASVVGFENLFATQFHLEKSGRPGLRMLENFCKWKP
ncbi:MAG: imidazole glycerol phosphate synthase subunit HisH [Thermodesulfobacteriota bacterium]|nr:imidazole glycerol phosphate synthase subunit HisH [Thermodesulfobacteriota bacterium]